MCANVAMGKQCVRRTPDDAPSVALSWLPWSHTMGGNAGLHGLLADGGTHYIDDGRPLPGQFDETIRNLREISTTSFGNVPAGFAALLTVLETDDALCQTFFKDLRMLAYGGATLPDDLYTRKIISPAQAERLLGAKQKSAIAPFVTRVVTGVNLVKASKSTRPAVGPKAERMFEPLED